jgi:hypothetical protein
VACAALLLIPAEEEEILPNDAAASRTTQSLLSASTPDEPAPVLLLPQLPTVAVLRMLVGERGVGV